MNSISFLIGLLNIQAWTKESLKTRLNKSLSNDWIPERSAHKFPLRQYYVQLEWKQKIRTAMGSETKTLTSLHELLKEITLTENLRNDEAAAKKHQTLQRLRSVLKNIRGKWKYKKTGGKAAKHHPINVKSIIIEGESFQDFCGLLDI